MDPDEACDDGNQRDNDCCISDCKVVLRRGTLCGEPALGECDVGDSCNSDGHCLPNPKPLGTECSDDGQPCTADQCDGAGNCSHPPGNAGASCHEPTEPCEVESFCDGESPDCEIDTSGCEGEVVPPEGKKKTIEVDCTAQDSVQGQASKCSAVGFQAATGAAGAIATGAVLDPDDGEGPQVTKRAARKLKRGFGAQGLPVRKRTLKLQLNRAGRKILNAQRVLDVSVHVEIQHGTSVKTIKRLIQFRR